MITHPRAAGPGPSAGVSPADAGNGGTAFQVQGAGATFDTSLPAGSVATYKWTPGAASVQEWLTSVSGTSLGPEVTLQPAIPMGGGPLSLNVGVDANVQQQTMVGFGGAMTDSAATLIDHLPAVQRTAVLNKLFGASGAGFNFVRVPIGASDLTDPNNKDSDNQVYTTFTLKHDLEYEIPLLRLARAVQPELMLLGTPWSAPGSMKYSGSFYGTVNNCLSTADQPDELIDTASNYAAYASYLTDFVKAYEANGLPINWLSMQNEPHNCKQNMPTMYLTAEQEIQLAEQLHSDLSSADLKLGTPGILAWDHNYYDGGSPATFPRTVLAGAGSDVGAIGYHCYDNGGNVNPFPTETVSYQETEIFMTECSGFYSEQNAAQNLLDEVYYALLGPIKYGASASLYWSLALDTQGGPHLPGSGPCADCRGLIAITETNGKPTGFRPTQDYYYWEQFSKFVEPGARVLATTDPGPESAGLLAPIETVAFRNPDGSIVLVALNTNFAGHIVQWDGDTKAQKTAWLVGPDGRRRWISDIATYNCLKANGASGPDLLGSTILSEFMPDLNNVWAVCGADRIGVNSMLQGGFYARSQNGDYTLRLTSSNLTLTGPGGHLIWSTGSGGDELILQADGNLVEYSGSTAVWASGTVGSGAAWLVVRNDGKLGLYNGDGNLVWTSEGPPSAYIGHIVQWDGDTKAQKTAWLVGPDDHRRWISNIATYNCLKSNGAPGPDVLTSWELNQMPDLTNVWAVCGGDNIGVNSMLQQNFYAQSQNGQYTLRLTATNLVLTDPSGNVLWSTGVGGDDLILQADGNLVEYSGSTPVWATSTVGSNAAWLFVNNNGTLTLYDTAGNVIWSS